MYKINEKILYKRDVCIIKEIKEKYVNDQDYLFLTPISDQSLIIKIPKNSNFIRPLPTKEEVLDLIDSIPNIKEIDKDDKMLENLYKELLSTEELSDLIRIIKTCYIRNKKRVDSGKKIGDKDDTYFKKAENYLYTTLSIPLNLSYDECKEYIIKTISEKEGQ